MITAPSTNRRRATVEVEPTTGLFRIVKGDQCSEWSRDVAVLTIPEGMYFAAAEPQPFGKYQIWWATPVRGKVVGV